MGTACHHKLPQKWWNTLLILVYCDTWCVHLSTEDSLQSSRRSEEESWGESRTEWVTCVDAWTTASGHSTDWMGYSTSVSWFSTIPLTSIAEGCSGHSANFMTACTSIACPNCIQALPLLSQSVTADRQYSTEPVQNSYCTTQMICRSNKVQLRRCEDVLLSPASSKSLDLQCSAADTHFARSLQQAMRSTGT